MQRVAVLAALAVVVASPVSARAAAGGILHVAPNGKLGARGTAESPMASLAEATEQVRPGDVIRLASGTYVHSQTIHLRAKGRPGHPLRLEAEGRVVLDFAAQPEDRERNHGLDLDGDWWELVGIEVAHAGGYGIYVTGSHNRVERCVTRENRGTGLHLDAPASHNLIVDCESYRNFDRQTRGENADGFAVKHAVGPGNVFRRCRAYQNADDGWDVWMAPFPVVIEDCLAFRNGFDIFGAGDFQGDGNGFKLGGNYVDVAHVVRRCVAIENPLNGFDQNHNLGPIVIEDSMAIRCGRGFALPEPARGGRIVLRGNTSFGTRNVLEPGLVQENNNWYPDIAPGPLGPPPRPGHRDVPGAGPVPANPPAPVYTEAPQTLAPPPEPLKDASQ